MSNSEKTAFPCDGQFAGECRNNGDSGLTKREYFAAKAMQGFLSNPALSEVFMGNLKTPVPKSISDVSIEIADEIINQLENSKP